MKLQTLLTASLLIIVSCTQKQPETKTVSSKPLSSLAEQGRALFEDTEWTDVGIACADCHAVVPDSIEQDGIRPGHSILGADVRTSTWNGEFSGEALRRTAAGAAKCAVIFQQRADSYEQALTESEAEALVAFYQSLRSGSEPEQIEWGAVSYPGAGKEQRASLKAAASNILALEGNAESGRELFGKACNVCHGPTGRGIGPSVKVLKKHLHHLPEVVRGGQENMPFFSRDKLTDKDIANIRAYVAKQ